MKKVYAILFLIVAVLISCKKEHVKDATPNFDSIVKMPYDEVEVILGKPIGNEASFFNIKKDGLGGARIGLNAIYKGFPDITVLEASWEKDSINDILIWYVKKGDKWQPIDNHIYERGTEF
jgi:hypothetical protein